MTIQELFSRDLAFTFDMLKMTLADFSEADMLVRPVPGANHALWQLGHLVCSEHFMVGACGAKMPAFPEGFAAKFDHKAGTAAVDDAKAFPTKGEVLEQFERVRAATVAFARSVSDADMDKPGPEPMRQYCPTVGSLLSMVMGHATMHMGQMQVIRRKLGKPILF